MDSEEPPTSSAWQYEPAADLDKTLSQRLREFPRRPHMWVYLLRGLFALALRSWLRLYHRFEVVGRERLPIGRSFIIVANHQSHLDALCLASTIPLRFLHRTFPAAAADYFFSDLPRSVLSSIIVNGLPFDRKKKGNESLSVCRAVLDNPGNILILFPEGTRSRSGEIGRFLPGIGRLCEGSDIEVVPAYLDGAYRAFAKGALFPRPSKLTLFIGEPRSYEDLPPGRRTVVQICTELRQVVMELGSGDATTTR